MGATFGFARKVGGAFGGFVMGVLLHIGGFVGEVETQSAAALMTIRISSGIVPLIAIIVVCILMRIYTLDKDLPALQAEATTGKKQL